MTYHFSSHGFLLGSDVRAMQSPEFGLLGNFVACEGKTTPVVKVRVKKRKGEDNFVTCMRKGLAKALEESKVKVDGAKSAQIGIGGVFKVVSGKIHGHVMPDFKKTVMIDGPEVDEWLNFYEMGPDLTCLSVFLSGDPAKADQDSKEDFGLDLRLEHTHFFSQSKKEGGHYHFDKTPDDVEYIGYFLPAPVVYRVDNAFARERACSKVSA
mmetsp:Transcript_22511/g.43841  ORF Transcript_22511/g.43841 Transcript_22511/m.43841 type:complete len:210 (-) Transcript_22511:179-808(-)